MTYTYSKQNDFTNGLDMGSFIDELQNAYIPVQNLVVQGDDVKVITTIELTTEQESTVNTIISNHSGESVVEIYTEKVKIVEEQVLYKTQGHFQARTIDMYISGVTGTSHVDISFPYPVSLFSSEWLVAESQIGDSAEFVLSPDTICGALTQPHSSGETTIHVSDTVFKQANIQLGYYIKINGQELGRVIAKDSENLTITVEEGLATDLSPGTYIMFTVKVVPHWRFNAPGFCSVGESKIGASYIPENTIMRLVYHNNTGTAKWFAISLDYLY